MSLSSDIVGLFVALEVLHPAGTFRLLSESGMITFGGHTFVGDDDNVGSIGAIELSSDGGGDDMPTLSVTILVANMTVLASLAIPSAQGAIVQLFQGEFDLSTGLVVGSPDLLFYGEIDTMPTSRAGKDGGDTALHLECVSGFERFFEVDDGARLSNAFHQSIWPSERGLEYTTSVLDEIPWGRSGDKPPLNRI